MSQMLLSLHKLVQLEADTNIRPTLSLKDLKLFAYVVASNWSFNRFVFY